MKQSLLEVFNSKKDMNIQDVYLMGLICRQNIKGLVSNTLCLFVIGMYKRR